NAIAGNERGFEEATRALFAADRERFAEYTETWPADIRTEALRLAQDAFSSDPTAAVSPANGVPDTAS
ncbi:MAG TPA: DUF2239 family protein, partial [Kofleriaceae bacterium]|nr:DUF2239 family protein [Kofleriaceae bacterium]